MKLACRMLARIIVLSGIALSFVGHMERAIYAVALGTFLFVSSQDDKQ